MLLLAAIPSVVEAQSADPTSGEAATGSVVADVQPEQGGFWLLGSSPNRRRAAGMWAMHPYEPQFPEVEWAQGFGTQFSTWFLGTFVNSYGERGFVAGIERNWFEVSWALVRLGGGYRTGFVTGYDGRLFPLAEKTPLLPFIGALAWVQVGAVGVDAYYVYRAITLEVSLRY